MASSIALAPQHCGIISLQDFFTGWFNGIKTQLIMRSSTIFTVLIAACVSARPQYDSNPANPHEWMAPSANDCKLIYLHALLLDVTLLSSILVRGPCPMLNTLSNHGFLPRDGRNITKENAIKGLKGGLNFNESLGGLMWEQAIVANPEPNATFFTLEMLNVHNVLEHDASLSRSDAFFGNNHIFNETVFNESRKWWTEETITAKQLAHSKIYRQLESRAMNPNYTFSASTEEFSLGEVAAPVVAFGELDTGNVNRSLVEYFFGQLLQQNRCSMMLMLMQRMNDYHTNWAGPRKRMKSP
jgi:hypothetical protein